MVVVFDGVMKDREDADREEIQSLMERSQQSLEKGDVEQSMRDQQQAFNLIKAKFPDGTNHYRAALETRQ
ncbi:unnamed protein product [Phytophthora fragariaefolia]|uniref:Unnamed protein product n=1 Tax=Phytophthora fragariaefolia TaxID=1490495 RepID=A0A9W6UD75_9STRA|nr:unnamed protein product [Phytophthora fragariaefolia]